jgi:AraC-like DNA-binding protein
MQLLRDAQAHLSIDRDSACLCLTRALVMLQKSDSQLKSRHGCLPGWQIKRVVDYIDTHLDSSIRTIQLAAVLSLSVSHFSHAFKNTFGVTPLVYVARRRIESARQIMLTTDSSLTDIAHSHGFCDQSHFIRTFRRQIGVTPQAWRRLCDAGLYEEQTGSTPRTLAIVKASACSV